MSFTDKLRRTKEDKIKDALDKIGNLEPTLYDYMFKEMLEKEFEFNSVIKFKSYIVNKLKIPSMGKFTFEYWKTRGWSLAESYIKTKECNEKRSKVSPFSREFWMLRINPITGKEYTEEEADYKRNSQRPIRKEYWIEKGYSLEDAKLKAKETKNKNDNNGKKIEREIKVVMTKRRVEYWLVRGYSFEEATKKVSESQATFSLEKCIKKHGEEKGRKLWLERQEKWQNSYKKANFSKVSQDLFWNIVENFEDLSDIYFAELSSDKIKDDSGENNELVLTLDKVIKPDFIDTKQMKIIEFDGEYWHRSNGPGIKEKDNIKLSMYSKFGYNVLIVRENEYKKDKYGVIKKCIEFLKV